MSQLSELAAAAAGAAAAAATLTRSTDLSKAMTDSESLEAELARKGLYILNFEVIKFDLIEVKLSQLALKFAHCIFSL